MRRFPARAEDNSETDNTYVAIASGAHMDFDRLRFVSERADPSESLLSVLGARGSSSPVKQCSPW